MWKQKYVDFILGKKRNKSSSILLGGEKSESLIQEIKNNELATKRNNSSNRWKPSIKMVEQMSTSMEFFSRPRTENNTRKLN